MESRLLCDPTTSLIYKNGNKDYTSCNDLSNELILEIFDYLSFNDIYLSFGHLNTRFNILIESYPHHFDFQSNQVLPNHIRSLKITQKCQLTLLFSLHHAHFLSSLRAISLGNLRPEQILDVFKQIELKQLQYIYLGVCANDGNNNKKVMRSVQTQILTLGQYQLKRCHLKNNLLVAFNDLPEILPSLKYLQVVGCENFCILSQFLSRMPNLKYIQTSIINLTEHIPISNSCCITHLILRPHANCSAKELGIFLKNCCASLKRLVIELQIYRSEQSGMILNKYQWLTIFPDRLTNFHLKMLPHPCDYEINISNLQKLPLRERILLIFSDQQEHYCEVIIDTPFIPIWQKE